MPVDSDFSFSVNGDTVLADINTVSVSGFSGGGFSLFASGRVQVGADWKDRRLRESISDMSALGTAFNAAKAELSITLTATEFRDLLLRMAQIAVENEAGS